MLSDIEITRRADIRPITEIAAKVGIRAEELVPYGKYKAKLPVELFDRVADRPDGKLILVTAITPTPAGEGKTTTTIGLGDALAILGKKTVLALREPSLGPVFGVKGGAAGGGYAQVIPMEDINLHFTGDIHAVTAANNLLCAMIDNHIHQGNALGIDPRTVSFKRVLDINDRALRQTIVGLGGKTNGFAREDGFMISVASEVMAVLCLSADLDDLKARLARIVIGRKYDGSTVTAGELKADGAMAALLRDALDPNLVQTLGGVPTVMHGGPFANIAHGCNSVRATRLALKLGDYTVTEAGFGADLGAEKFFDIKCRAAGLRPDAAVIVASVRALKYSGGKPKDTLAIEDLDALKKGMANLGGHINNVKKYGVPVVVALNRFGSDTDAELKAVADYCASLGVRAELSEVFAKGGEGGIELAKAVIEAAESGKADFAPIYPLELTLKEKINAVARNIYGADCAVFSALASKQLAELEADGFGNLPVCIAKTQYSFSDDPTLQGRPTGFELHVASARVSAGAGFVVVLTGDIMTMPGLPKVPAAENITVDGKGNISGLF
ncbi:MAG: formate--tetrahydrofolate ligase [Clostridia bacterium]|nr:formate--tetrahydrofolate ligase [Clostridia bacterium]